MKKALRLIAAVLVIRSCLSQIEAQEVDKGLPTLIRTNLHFSEAAPYSDAEGITKHLGYTVPLPEYAVTNELFDLRAPETILTNESWGLLVWISPNDEPTIPADWDTELARQHLLFASAHRSGNMRHPLDRFRLALDATCNVCRRYKVDRKRIYIGGFSGGARIASMLGVGYGDIYTGTLCVCGVNFYTDIPGTGGKYYPATFTPNPTVLPLSKRTGRFVLLTGEHDENRENTTRVASKGFRSEGFRNVLYLEVPGMRHEIPSGKTLATALEYLGNTPQGGH